MTTLAPGRPAAGTSEQGPSARGIARSVRFPLAILVALVLIAALAIALGGRRSTETLARDSFTQQGGHALATLVAAQGVDVEDDLPATAQRSTVVFVPVVSRLSDDQVAAVLNDVRDDGSTAVVALASDDDVSRLGLTVQGDAPPNDVLTPGCSNAAATNAGDVELGDSQVLSIQGGDVPSGFTNSVVTCYGTESGATEGEGAMIVLTAEGGGTLVLLADTTFLQNDHLTGHGNAALGIGLLAPAGTQELVWLQPALGAENTGATGGKTLLGLVPRAFRFGIFGLIGAAVLLALARSRRLGAVVPEQLPVVVRSVETVQTRARLYRARGARDRAAANLRQATRGRLAQRLGLGPDTSPQALVSAVAARAGMTDSEVGTLLYGTRVADDDDLVTTARQLDDLSARALGTTTTTMLET